MKNEAKTAGKKGRRFELRLSPGEYQRFANKAKDYPSMSALIIDAVDQFNVKKGRNRIDVMIEFASVMQRLEADLGRIGNNINQIARNLNLARITGDPILGYIQEAEKAIGSYNNILKDLHKELTQIRKKK